MVFSQNSGPLSPSTSYIVPATSLFLSAWRAVIPACLTAKSLGVIRRCSGPVLSPRLSSSAQSPFGLLHSQQPPQRSPTRTEDPFFLHLQDPIQPLTYCSKHLTNVDWVNEWMANTASSPGLQNWLLESISWCSDDMSNSEDPIQYLYFSCYAPKAPQVP